MCGWTCVCISIFTLLVVTGVQLAEIYLNPVIVLKPNNGSDVTIQADVENMDNSSAITNFLPKDLKMRIAEMVSDEKYKYMLETNEVNLELYDGCTTEKFSYGCCYKFPEVKFLVCINMTYLPHDYGLNLTVTIGDAVFSEEVSLRNPPPICLNDEVFIPYKVAKVCLRIHDIDVTPAHVHFCGKLYVEILIKSIYTKELGCVDIPIKKV